MAILSYSNTFFNFVIFHFLVLMPVSSPKLESVKARRLLLLLTIVHAAFTEHHTAVQQINEK